MVAVKSASKKIEYEKEPASRMVGKLYFFDIEWSIIEGLNLVCNNERNKPFIPSNVMTENQDAL